jgi:hypothetical protein
MMEHDEALEALELAAVEPGGLDRLMAGDTAVAAAVAGHVAGCESCAAELGRLSAVAPLLRDVIRTTPSPDLRARTLAFVEARGVARAQPVSADQSSSGPRPLRPLGDADAAPAASVPAASREVAATRSRSVVPWIAAIAAAVVISVVASTAVLNARLDAELASQQETIEQLSAVTAATLAVTGEPDVERVALASDTGLPTAGTLLFSPSTTELVVVATDLAPAPEGQEYRCWVIQDGERESVGKMFFGGDLAYWIGDVEAVAGLTEGATFGVSLVDIDGTSLDAEPVMTGDL